MAQTTPRHKVATVIFSVLIGLTAGMIWHFSLIPAVQSGEQSGLVQGLLIRLLGDNAFTAWLLTQTVVRKLAHFAEFFVLGAEWAGYRRFKKWPAMWLYGLPVAVIDELLQFFSPGRAPMVKDVLLDTAGSLCGYLAVTGVICLVIRIRETRKTRKNRKNSENPQK